MRLRHVYKLATTKLHAKPALQFITIALSVVLFALLYAGIITLSGFISSQKNYIESINNHQYLVRVEPRIPTAYQPSGNMNITIETVHKLRALEEKYVKEQTAFYKTRGVTFKYPAESGILREDPFADSSKPKELRYVINANSPVYPLYVQSLMLDYAQVAKNTLPNLTELAVNTYGATSVTPTMYSALSTVNTVWLENNKEDFSRYAIQWRPDGIDFDPYSLTIASARTSSYAVNDVATVRQFLFKENDRQRQNKSAIPVIITQSEAVEMFGASLNIEARPNNLSDRAIWAAHLAEKVNGQTYQSCYRNKTEMMMLEKYRSDTQAIADNAGNKDYIAPQIQYALPLTPCGEITVAVDTRTDTQKHQDELERNMQKVQGTYEEPHHELLTFVVVGLIPFERQAAISDGILPSLDTLFGVTNFNGAVIPRQSWHPTPEQEKLILEFKDKMYEPLEKMGLRSALVSFSDVESARLFMQREACVTADAGSSSCDKPYGAQLFGSNYFLFNDIQTLINKTTSFILPVIFVLATLVMLFAMARTVIESRKETAVFRSMGANRGDIAAIYLTYGLLLSTIIAIVSFVLGFGGALLVNGIYSSQLTDYAAALQPNGTKLTFTLIDLQSPLILFVSIAIFVIGCMATLLPLTASVGRAPADDMRD